MIFVESRDYPVVSLQLHFQCGGQFDPPGKEGLTYLTAQMLIRGTATHTQAEFSEAVEFLGASVSVVVGREFITLYGGTLSRNLTPFLDLAAAAVTHPSFELSELDKLRRLVIAEVEEMRDNDEATAQHVFYQALYQPDTYARPIKGTRASLNNITLDDVLACYRNVFTQKALHIAAVGDAAEATLEAEITARLASLPQGETPVPNTIESRDPGTIKVILIDKPQRTQTQIFGGHLALPAIHPDRFPLLVANTAYGGTFTARLSHEIREKRGWSYGAHSYLIGRRTHGAFFFRFYPAMKDAVPALALGLAMQKEFIVEGLTEDEVTFARDYLINHFPFRIETPRKRLQELVRLHMLALPPSYLDTFRDKIAAVQTDQVNSAVASHLKYDDLTIAMVCTATPLEDQIRALPGVGEVIVHPYDKDWPHPGA